MKNVVVIGATGDVGRGIVGALIRRGHGVTAVARNAERLAALTHEISRPAQLLAVAGSLESDASAQVLIDTVRAATVIDAVVVSVNSPRKPTGLFNYSSGALTAVIQGDLVSHYTAARAFVPLVKPGGVFLGIGGGSCDFILEGGIPQSVSQAGLRMLYRGMAHEFKAQAIELRELIIASVVNGVSNRGSADPSWVTDGEIGEHVAAIIDDPGAFPGPILRIARRDETGRPVLSAESATRVQGFR